MKNRNFFILKSYKYVLFDHNDMQFILAKFFVTV